MFFKKLLANLHLFDGEGGAAAATGSAESASSMGETKGAVPGNTRRGKSGEFGNVKFGKQDAATDTGTEAAEKTESPDAEGDKKDAKAPDTLEDRRKAFDALINGEYKDLFAEKAQGLINSRFREAKQLEAESAKTKPVLDMLYQKYGIPDSDVTKLQAAIEKDNSMWEEAADAAGMGVEQFKEMQRLKRENKAFNAERQRAHNEELVNKRIQGWVDEGAALKAKFPDFDFESESRDPKFMSMLRSGVPVEHAYKIKYFDKIMSDTKATTAAETEKRVVDNIRAKGTKPVENGAAAQSAFTVMDDPATWNKKHRAEIARRVARGEEIKL